MTFKIYKINFEIQTYFMLLMYNYNLDSPMLIKSIFVVQFNIIEPQQ